MKFPIGIQLFSVRDEMTADPEGTLKQIKEMGYDGVEFAGMYRVHPREAAEPVRAVRAEPHLRPCAGRSAA